MNVPTTQARPRALGRLILRRVFDAPHRQPRPHLELRPKPSGNEGNEPSAPVA
ncbi:MAG TPA: hypothetical protein VFI31_14235 [Pirellulales bacterium]|nr:hypothetical protein [Pirellulales bacterium]